MKTAEEIWSSEFAWLPKPLLQLCDGIVTEHHKKFRGTFSKGTFNEALDNLSIATFAAKHSTFLVLFKAAKGAHTMWIAAHVVGAAAIVLGVLVNGWIALGVVPAIAAAIHFRQSERGMYITMIAIMLAMEFLANNVTRTGELHPDAARKALEMMADFPPNDRTHLLDIYLPRRAELPSDLYSKFETQPS